MPSGTKVLLETIQVARHLGRLGARPLQKAVGQAARAGEDFALWTLKLQPLQEVLGRRRTDDILNFYMQAKEVAGQSVASLSHQSWTSALQAGAQHATTGLNKAGVGVRVVGPLDEHWNVLRVVKELQAAEGERAAMGSAAALRLTPKRFVRFMRDAERRRRRARQRDPIEDYVDRLLSSSRLSSMAPKLERKLYMDVARIICFAFDRALMEINGTDIWGHELHVLVSREASDLFEPDPDHVHYIHPARTGQAGMRSAVSVEHVEAVVNRMLHSKDLEVPFMFSGMQRQLLVNCGVMLLQLVEDLTSDRHMQFVVLGHSLRVNLEPLDLSQVWREDDESGAKYFKVNNWAVDELVEALIDEPEVSLVLMPDVVEAEIYRKTLHRMICIAQVILSQLRIRMFGSEVRLSLLPIELSPEEKAAEAGSEESGAERLPGTEVRVPDEELQALIDRIEYERHRVEQELHRRREGEVTSSHQLHAAEEEEEHEAEHEFQAMAAQDRLSRSLHIARSVDVPIDVAYRMVSDFDDYPKWMPFCTDARTVPSEGPRARCEVGFGLETGTVLGTVGDTISYSCMLSPPSAASGAPGEGGRPALRSARVVADTPDGFRYGKRIVYDWRFSENERGETDVRLDMFFQARSVFFLPLWDSMQSMITGAMMTKFTERAEVLKGLKTAADNRSGL